MSDEMVQMLQALLTTTEKHTTFDFSAIDEQYNELLRAQRDNERLIQHNTEKEERRVARHAITLERRAKRAEKRRARKKLTTPHHMFRRSTLKTILNTTKVQSGKEQQAIISILGQSKCITCQQLKDLSEFFSNFRFIVQKQCIDCFNNMRNTNAQQLFIKHVLSRSKASAKKRNLFFDLTEQQLHDMYEEQKGLCALSGRVIVVGYSRNPTTNVMLKNPGNLSLDRIDSAGGYTKSNVQMTQLVCNLAKSDMSSEAFFNLCRDVYLWHEKKRDDEQSHRNNTEVVLQGTVADETNDTDDD